MMDRTRNAVGTFMPYHFDFDPIHRILRTRFDGQLTDEQMREYYAVASNLADSLDLSGGIMDLSAVTSLEVTPHTMRELAKLRPAIADPDIPRVIVAPSPTAFGLARMFELYGEGTRPNLHVVTTHAAAYAILRIVNPTFKPLDEI